MVYKDYDSIVIHYASSPVQNKICPYPAYEKPTRSDQSRTDHRSLSFGEMKFGANKLTCSITKLTDHPSRVSAGREASGRPMDGRPRFPPIILKQPVSDTNPPNIHVAFCPAPRTLDLHDTGFYKGLLV